MLWTNGNNPATYPLAGFARPISGADLSNSVNLAIVPILIQGF
jgi:hypothetical protein